MVGWKQRANQLGPLPKGQMNFLAPKPHIVFTLLKDDDTNFDS